MLPRLQAEERLNAITDGSISAGTMPRDDQRDVLEKLRETAAIARTKPANAGPAHLAAMGIAIRPPSAPSKEGVSDG